MVAEDGWKLLPQYLFNLESGEWLHHSNPALSDRKSLQSISYDTGTFSFLTDGNDVKAPFNLYDTLLKAKEVIKYVITNKNLDYNYISRKLYYF